MKIRGKRIPPENLILSAAGAAILAALLAVWWTGHSGAEAAAKAAALLNALLFALVGVRFVSRWMEEWRARRGGVFTERLREPVRAAVLVRIFFACLGAELAAVGLFWLLRVMQEGWKSFSDAMDVWTHLDTRHYLDIARDWYASEGESGRVVQLVFLPGYPLAVRLAAWVTGNYLTAAFAVSLVSIAGAGVVLYCLARLDMDHAAALRTLKYALLLPGAVFFPGPMSESLFFLLCVSCVYLTRQKKWLPACLVGALASFTRSLGLVLAVPVCYELISDTLTARPEGWDTKNVERRVWDFAALLLIPLGFGAYCLISWRVTGDPFKFMEYQREHWNQSPGLFFNTAAYQTQYVIKRFQEGAYTSLLGLWLPNLLCIFGALGLMLPGVKRLRPSYTAYFLIYYGIAVGPTWLLSGPRYLAAAFPLGLALASLTEDRRADSVCTVVLTVTYVLYAYGLMARWQVW